MYTAKAQLSRLLQRAENGEEIVITRHGRPVAKLVSVQGKKEPRRLGRMKGRIRAAKDFDAPLPEEILRAFEGDRS